MYDKMMAELDGDATYVPDDQGDETHSENLLASRNVQGYVDPNFPQGPNFTVDPASSSYAQNQQPYAININYINN